MTQTAVCSWCYYRRGWKNIKLTLAIEICAKKKIIKPGLALFIREIVFEIRYVQGSPGGRGETTTNPIWLCVEEMTASMGVILMNPEIKQNVGILCRTQIPSSLMKYFLYFQSCRNLQRDSGLHHYNVIWLVEIIFWLLSSLTLNWIPNFLQSSSQASLHASDAPAGSS